MQLQRGNSRRGGFVAVVSPVTTRVAGKAACLGPDGHAHSTEVVGMGWGWSLQPGQAGELQARSAWNGNGRILLQCRGARPGRAFAPCPPGPRTWSTLPRLQLGLSSKMSKLKLPQHFVCQNGAG